MSEQFNKMKEQLEMQLRISGSASGLSPIVGVMKEFEARLDIIEEHIKLHVVADEKPTSIDDKPTSIDEKSAIIVPSAIKNKVKK